MAWHDWGNRPIFSTTAQPVTNPSTATLVAVVDSTQLGTANFVTGQKMLARVTWLLGSDTSATWQCEVATSSTLADGNQDVVFVKTPTGQSGQYVTVHELQQNARVRARLNSTFTGTATASIMVEPLT